ncbi:replication-associated protein [Crucivirus-527]|nr:replication-associated protein [Crucivirus-527]QMW69026.1 replication-associated protein [Crucivirus-528]
MNANNKTSRHFCFTWFKFPFEWQDLPNIDLKVIRYLILGYEICPETGREHLQCYMELFTPQRFSWLKNFCERKVHCEPRFGPRDRARLYCMKGDQTKKEWKKHHDKGQNFGLNSLFFEYGVWLEDNSGGLNSALIEYIVAIKAGKNDLELADEHPASFVRYPRAIDRIRSTKRPKREDPLSIFLYIGKPGTGKTRRAYELYPDIYAPPIGKDLWFNGYQQEPEVLLDDFSGQLRLVDTLRLLDLYAIQAPTKGGFCWWCPTIIIITTNVHPRDWYDYSKRNDSEIALKRRFTGVLNFDLPNPPANFTCQTIDEYWTWKPPIQTLGNIPIVPLMFTYNPPQQTSIDGGPLAPNPPAKILSEKEITDIENLLSLINPNRTPKTNPEFLNQIEDNFL